MGSFIEVMGMGDSKGARKREREKNRMMEREKGEEEEGTRQSFTL